MRKLVLASKNPNKVREIREILSDLDIEILDMSNFPNLPDIIEDGKTFEENALIKARQVFQIVKMPVLSDDSGLEVESLNMQPGVYSARFAGIPTDYKKNNEKLLRYLANVPDIDRNAQFRCVVVFKTKESETIAEGICRGRIIKELRGKGGFGYDPLFIPDGYNQTFAELPKEIKNSISHRAIALQKIKPFIIQFFQNI